MVGYASAVGSHVGMVRSNNQDSGYAGYRLFLVADGMGGHAGGDVASALTAQAMARIDAPFPLSTDTAGTRRAAANQATPPLPETSEISPLAADATSGPVPISAAKQARTELNNPHASADLLRDELLQTNRMLRATVGERPELAGMGTTFSGFVTVGDQLALAHIGDSRLYLLRDGVMTQITKDHTFVQRLVDSGRITEEEAKIHPRRSVLMRVLGDVESHPEIDTSVIDTKVGDLWMLCSDGLCGYVEDEDIARILRRRSSLQNGIDELIDKSLENGAPDNVTVVLVETTAEPIPAADQAGPRFVGSAETEVPASEPVSTARTRLLTRRRVRRAQPVAESHFEPRVDEYLKELIAETKRRNRRRRIAGILGLLAIIAVLAGALSFGYQWTQSRYYVGTDGATVVIYRGVPQSIVGVSLNSVAEDTKIPLDSLDGNQQRQLERTLGAASLEEARDIVTRLGASQ